MSAPLTRAAMVTWLIDQRSMVLRDVAAELAKECSGCKHWHPNLLAMTNMCGNGVQNMPADGSGYCRPGWEPREAKP